MFIQTVDQDILTLWEDTEQNRELLADERYGLSEYKGDVEKVRNFYYKKGTYVPPVGFKVVDEELVEKSIEERLDEGILDRSVYLRKLRDDLLVETDWMANRYWEQEKLGLSPDKTILEYRQYLRDFPENDLFKNSFRIKSLEEYLKEK